MQDARCIFAIHNLSHQGVEPAATFGNFGLPEDWCALTTPQCPHGLLQTPVSDWSAHLDVPLLQ